MKESLVDKVEQRLFEYFREHDYHVDDYIPGETLLAEELGVARSVLREALSRFKLVGLITSRPRVGMRLTEPSLFTGIKTFLEPRYYREETLLSMLEMRMIMEVGWARLIAPRVSDKYLDLLGHRFLPSYDVDGALHSWKFEYSFHSMLYNELPNQVFSEFLRLLYIGVTYTHAENKGKLQVINERLKNEGRVAGSHRQIIEAFRTQNAEKAAAAVEAHFLPYVIFIEEERKRLAAQKDDEE